MQIQAVLVNIYAQNNPRSDKANRENFSITAG